MANTHRAEDHRQARSSSGQDVENVVRFARPERLLTEEPSPLALAQLIEGEIIPRLLMAHRDAPDGDVIQMTTGVIEPAELERFSRQVMVSDLATLLEHIELLIRRGVGVDKKCLS